MDVHSGDNSLYITTGELRRSREKVLPKLFRSAFRLFFGLEYALDALVKDVTRDNEQQDSVDGGGQDFESPIAEDAFVVGGLLADVNGRERQSQRRRVCEHVRRVGQQG